VLYSAFRLELLVLGLEFFLGLGVVRVDEDTVYRADFDTLRLVVMADTLGAEIGIDLIDFVTLADSAVGAFGFTYIAVNTFVGNHQCHGTFPPAILPKSAGIIAVY